MVSGLTREEHSINMDDCWKKNQYVMSKVAHKIYTTYCNGCKLWFHGIDKGTCVGHNEPGMCVEKLSLLTEDQKRYCSSRCWEQNYDC